MFYKNLICPYIKQCKKFRNGDCRNVKRFEKCGEYKDSVLISLGIHDSMCKLVLEKLKEFNKRHIPHEKSLNNECPFKSVCYHIFIKPCNKKESNGECHPFECEDCELNLRDYGEYCDTAQYEQCETYEVINTIREALEEEGVDNTEDLKKYYGEENYPWLGGFIRAAFMEPGDIV